jgi:thiol-disulfide isomerase/thioredoxin
MATSTRITLAVLALAAALVVGLAGQIRSQPPQPPAGRVAADDGPAVSPQSLAGPRQQAALPPCPAADGGPGPQRLRDVVVECAADGSPVAVGPAFAGRAMVVNLWAYWCEPCVEELPALQDYARQAGDAVTVVTVHQDRNEAAALLRMAELGVRLPVLQDSRRQIAAALSVPNVMPATVVLRRDGTVAAILPRAFSSAAEIDSAVGSALQ